MRKNNVSVKNVKTINVKTGEVKQSRVETTTLDERPSIWNLQAFVIVFLFIILGTTINVYSSNNDNLTWIDSNGDFKVNSYDHSMINLDTDLIELNGLSLNEVFNTGNLMPNYDFSDSSTSFYSSYNTSIYDHSTGVLIATGNDVSTRAFVYIDNLINTIDTFYLSVEKKTEISNNANTRTYAYGLYSAILYGNNDWQRYSDYGTLTATSTRFFIDDFRNDTLLSTDKTYTDNVYLINATDLGIDNLTKNEIDEYYDLYVSLQENRIEAYKELGGEPISQWQNLTQHLQLVIDAITGPINNISDWINKFMNGLFS